MENVPLLTDHLGVLIDAWCMDQHMHSPCLSERTDLLIDGEADQPALTINRDAIVSYIRQLIGDPHQPLDKVLQIFLPPNASIEPAVQYLSGNSDDGAQDLVKILARLIADNHLPSPELHGLVFATFTDSSGQSLVQYLDRHGDYGTEAFLEVLQRVSSCRTFSVAAKKRGLTF
jgi:hypothetical protein